jgi:pimeloyl-ACP methyl ester carboxylesterase
MAKTIYMIHGMWGGPWYWENYIKYFKAKGYNCIAATLRYHDMDPKDPPDPRLGRTSLLDYADDLEKEIRALNEPPVIMGHSMGGILAQMLGARGLARSLVLLTPASPRGILALRPSVIWSYIDVMIRWGFWRKPMRQPFARAVYSMLNLLSPDERRAAYDRFVYESGRAACELGFWFFDRMKATAVDASRVNCPVLVIAGAHDRITPVSVVRKVADYYKRTSTYREFSDHAHWVLSEPGWEEIAAFIDEWLASKSSPR